MSFDASCVDIYYIKFTHVYISFLYFFFSQRLADRHAWSPGELQHHRQRVETLVWRDESGERKMGAYTFYSSFIIGTGDFFCSRYFRIPFVIVKEHKYKQERYKSKKRKRRINS